MSNNNTNRTSPRFANTNFEMGDINAGTTPIRPKKKVTTNNNRIYDSSFDDSNPAAHIVAHTNNNNMQFHLQKLDFLYQNLEGRVSKLERIIAEQLFITTSPSPQTISMLSSNSVYNLNDFNSIESSSTSTSTATSSFSNNNNHVADSLPREILV